jgi:hypothetical protein
VTKVTMRFGRAALSADFGLPRLGLPALKWSVI